MTNLKKGSVLILDFGSQYTQLIARRVRENDVFSEILPLQWHQAAASRLRNNLNISLASGPNQ